MQSMNITKSKFMEFIRCDRYPALYDILKRRDYDDATKDKYYDLLSSLELNIEEDEFLVEDTTHLEVMMPYFNQVEVLTAKKVMEYFGGETTYSTEYGKQKLFARDYKHFNLMCYVDVFNRQDNHINIVEVKATTTNKFMSLGYTEDKVKQSIFIKDENNILRLKEELDPTILDNKKYQKQRVKLLDWLRDEGIYVYDLAFQRFVIEEDIKDASYYLGVLNHEFVFDGTSVNNKPIYGTDAVCLIDLTRITKEMQSLIQAKLQRVIMRIKNSENKPVTLGKHCKLKKMRECIYKDICYNHIPEENNILMYLDKHHGFKDPTGDKHEYFDMVNDGMVHMLDVPETWLHRKNNQIQREVARTHVPYFNLDKIKDGLNEIQYPIYHLDFESFPCPLPRFKAETPYMQSLFQFSLHIERSPGVCDKESDHYEYLAPDSKDHREDLVKALCEVILDDGGSVLVYNEAFEKTRIKELAEMYPDYSEKLQLIRSRLFDLLHIVKTNSKLYTSIGYNKDEAKVINYYHEDLKGSFSIKKVLPLFSTLSYNDMPVGNGMEAVYTYARYNEYTKEELQEKRKHLTAYCKQDTWAMVEILDKLRELS